MCPIGRGPESPSFVPMARLVEEVRRTNQRHSALFGRSIDQRNQEGNDEQVLNAPHDSGACIAVTAGLMASMAGAAAADATDCTYSTGFRNLTAKADRRRQRRPATLDAAGCDIGGVYYGPGRPAL